MLKNAFKVTLLYFYFTINFVLNIQPQSIYSFIYPIVIIFSKISCFVDSKMKKKLKNKPSKKQLLSND